MNSRDKIKKWMKANRLTYAELGKAVGYTKEHTWNVLAGNSPIKGDFLLAVEKFSKGALKAIDLYDRK